FFRNYHEPERRRVLHARGRGDQWRDIDVHGRLDGLVAVDYAQRLGERFAVNRCNGGTRSSWPLGIEGIREAWIDDVLWLDEPCALALRRWRQNARYHACPALESGKPCRRADRALPRACRHRRGRRETARRADRRAFVQSGTPAAAQGWGRE